MPSDQAYYRFAMHVFADFGVSIAVPAIAGVLFGKWLDERFATSPRYLIIFVAIAFALTALIIVRKAKRYGKEYEKLMEKDKKTETNV